MYFDIIAHEKKLERKRVFEEWYKSPENVEVKRHISDILKDNENMLKRIREYEDYFEKLSLLLPKKFSPLDIIK